jgi:hypothetical protein
MVLNIFVIIALKCRTISCFNDIYTDHLEDPGAEGGKILRWIFRKWDVGHGLDRAGSG